MYMKSKKFCKRNCKMYISKKIVVHFEIRCLISCLHNREMAGN